MHVLGLDLGTVCGAADGPPGGKPNIWTWKLKGKTRPVRFATFQVNLENYFLRLPLSGIELKDTLVFYEEPMTLGVLISKTQRPTGAETNDNAITVCRGLVGILEAAAARARVAGIYAVDVHDAHKSMLGKSRSSKERVFEMCKTLSWHCENLNESDACAVWNYGAAKSNPRLAHLSTPLFGSR